MSMKKINYKNKDIIILTKFVSTLNEKNLLLNEINQNLFNNLDLHFFSLSFKELNIDLKEKLSAELYKNFFSTFSMEKKIFNCINSKTPIMTINTNSQKLLNLYLKSIINHLNINSQQIYPHITAILLDKVNHKKIVL